MKKKFGTAGILALIFGFLAIPLSFVFVGVLFLITSVVFLIIDLSNSHTRNLLAVLSIPINAVALIVFVLAVVLVSNGSIDTNTPSSKVASSSNINSPAPTPTPIQYTKYNVSELMDDLDSNAMKAEKKYTDQYVELTGKMYNIDSDGKYIDLCPNKEETALIGVQCYMKNDEQKNKIMNMKKDQTITIKGKIKEVGEVMGYSLDIDEVE
jgi:ABC-type antimicrobial peptide transport system permease subunit